MQLVILINADYVRDLHIFAFCSVRQVGVRNTLVGDDHFWYVCLKRA